MDHIPLSRLHQAVDAGIINAAQLDALLALEAGPGDSLDALPAQVEEQKGLNAISVAYWGGAIAVLFAFGWFLVDRWQVLGPGGVLVVTVVYAGLFALAARLLMRAGFHTAAALAALCVVGMTPIIAWAALALAGLWELYETGQRLAVAPPPWDTLRWLPIDLATILAALVALRRVRFAVLALPVAIALWALLGHASSAFIDPESLVYMWDRVHLVAATVLLGAAYSLDQRARHAEDYAFWFYLVGLVALTVAIGGIWNEATKLLVAHATLALAILLVVAALWLRRRVCIAFAALGLATVSIGATMVIGGLMKADALKSRYAVLVVVCALVIGALLGEAIGVEVWLERFGHWLRRAVGRLPFVSAPGEGEHQMVEGFVAASLLFCVGTMTVVGSLQDGLGDPGLLYVKALLDGIAALALASTLGAGVGFSAIPILVLQGGIALGAHALQPLLTEPVVREMTTVGGALIVAIGLDLLDIKRLPVGNLMPAVFLAGIFGALFG